MIKNALLGAKKNPIVQGQAKEDQSIQKKHKKDIERAIKEKWLDKYDFENSILFFRLFLGIH